MRLDGYIRVSKVGGRSGPSFISPEVQRDQIRRWAALGGHSILTVHTDLDQSGASDDRPGLTVALERAEAGISDGVIVAKLDRFARSLVGALEAITRLDAAGASFISVAEGLDPTTPAGKMMTRLMLVMAEFELDRLRESWDEANKRAVARGVHVSSKTATGYRRGAGGRLEPDPDLAGPISVAFRMRASCRSYPEVADFLKANGIGHSSVGPDRWSAATMINLFRNPVYLGEARSGRHRKQGAHPPLIDLATFELAQASRCLSGLRSGEHPSMLAGLLRCGGCRYCMKLGGQRRPDPQTKLYRCQPARTRPPCPQSSTVRRLEVEPLAERRFFELLERPPYSRRPTPAELRAAEDGLIEVRTEIRSRLDAWRTGRTGRPEPQLRAQRRALARARRSLLELARAASLPTAAELKRSWPTMATIERRRHLAMAIDVIFLRQEDGLELEDRLLVVPFGRGPEDLPRTGVRMAVKPFAWPSPAVVARW
jgi:site-specific DNA recombinase